MRALCSHRLFAGAGAIGLFLASPSHAGTITWAQNLSATSTDTGFMVHYYASHIGDERADSVSVEIEAQAETRAAGFSSKVDPGTAVMAGALFPPARGPGRRVVVARMNFSDVAGARFGTVMAHVHVLPGTPQSHLLVQTPPRVTLGKSGRVSFEVVWKGRSPVPVYLRFVTADGLPKAIPAERALTLAPGRQRIDLELARDGVRPGVRGPVWVVVEGAGGEALSEVGVDSFLVVVEELSDGAKVRFSVLIWAASGIILLAILLRRRWRRYRPDFES